MQICKKCNQKFQIGDHVLYNIICVVSGDDMFEFNKLSQNEMTHINCPDKKERGVERTNILDFVS